MMDDLDINEGQAEHHLRHRRGRGIIAVLVAVLVALAVIVAIGVFAYVKGAAFLKDRFDKPADYAGSGHGSIVVEVKEGESSADIAATLKKADVVKSKQAFVDAATDDERSLGIQVGHYRLKLQMSAKSALARLLNPKSRVTSLLTIPEGKRAKEILALIAKDTDFSAKQLQHAASRPASFGLPHYADGELEGYLFPATYDITPDMKTAVDVLAAMVARFEEEAKTQGLEEAATQLGITPGELVVVASLVQAEARRPQDMPKVARVVYNRLKDDMPLQFDSTLHYAVDSRGEVSANGNLRDLDSPYNSYKLTGLPPTAIDSPGADALNAALHPAEGGWLYFVTVNLATGETRFADDFAEHQRNVQLYFDYCKTSDEC